MPHTSSVLPPQEHLRQLHRVYGPLSPAFVAEELQCTLEEAAFHLYGPHSAQYVWVSLADLAHLSAVSLMGLKRWVRRHHLQSAYQQGQGRTAPPYIHLDDARHFLHGQQHLTAGMQCSTVDMLPRVRGEDLGSSPALSLATKANVIDMDWHLARQAAWPMTVDRLAEAIYGSRSAQARQQTQKTLRRWEAQGRVVCFARGLYDLVRPVLVLDPERYGRSVLPREDIQKLHAHHPEIAHWAARSLAAAWRAYSRFYAGMLLPVADRGEPTFLEYLLVCQLNPAGMPGEVNARYEELCQEAAFYRLVPVQPQSVPETEQAELTLENIEAGLIDFKAAAEATRLKMQRDFSKGQTLGLGRRTTASRARGVQENV
ncbi:hypothetical protein [Deinococcus marmoris]|uniref:hypothetical protein n=1 Tax=Deinococcus marmoris TaxID=249408 RepID=UPI000AEE5D48|nr:hypothetical protein [Deinococcus marmoris]